METIMRKVAEWLIARLYRDRDMQVFAKDEAGQWWVFSNRWLRCDAPCPRAE